MTVRADDGALNDPVTIPQGSVWNRSWPITGANGNPLDITGWSVRAQIRQSPSSPVVLFEWNTTSGPGIGTATASGTTAGISLSGTTDSSSWEFLSGLYDVLLTDPGGHPTRIVEGTVGVTPAITR